MGNMTVQDRNQYDRANLGDAPRVSGAARRRDDRPTRSSG